jgi:hypothetical protein
VHIGEAVSVPITTHQAPRPSTLELAVSPALRVGPYTRGCSDENTSIHHQASVQSCPDHTQRVRWAMRQVNNYKHGTILNENSLNNIMVECSAVGHYDFRYVHSA